MEKSGISNSRTARVYEAGVKRLRRLQHRVYRQRHEGAGGVDAIEHGGRAIGAASPDHHCSCEFRQLALVAARAKSQAKVEDEEQD